MSTYDKELKISQSLIKTAVSFVKLGEFNLAWKVASLDPLMIEGVTFEMWIKWAKAAIERGM